MQNNGSNSYSRNGIDWWLVLIYGLLVIFGWMNIYAANFNPETKVFFSVDAEYFKQLIWIGVSLLSIGTILLIDSKFFVSISGLLYVASIILLFTVLAIGKEVNGAKSWFEIGPIRFQPVEITKVATALLVARIMSRYGFSFNFTNYAKLAAVVMLPVLCILLQNDTGSALVYFVLVLPMFREGLSPIVILIGFLCVIAASVSFLIDSLWVQLALVLLSFVALWMQGIRKDLAIAIGVGLVATAISVGYYYLSGKQMLKPEIYLLIGSALFSAYLAIRTLMKRFRNVYFILVLLWAGLCTSFATEYAFENLLGEHQRTRINVLFGLEEDLLGAGYNVNQSMIAIGSGGFAGKGFLQGTQTKFNFVPEQTTDFIFCTIGEEWGFLGCLAVISLFVIFLLRMIYVAERQHSAFSRVYGYCVASIFFFHFAINICMTIGLAPVIGIPLPFFSYGGSSLWGFSILLFIFVKLDINREELIR